MKTTTLVYAICAPLLMAPIFAHSSDILNISTGDAHKVSIELSEHQMPQLIIFLKSTELKNAQKIISDNYKKNIAIQINGKTVSKPSIQIEPPFTGQSIPVGFDDVDEAVAAAKEIMKKAEQGAAANP